MTSFATTDRSRRATGSVLPLILFALGHLFVDIYTGALGALQPLLVRRFGLTLAQAGVLGGALVLSGSVMQPAYGYLSDRIRTRLFSALGPAIAGVFISSLGLAPTYGWLVLAILLGGAGIAMFHPQASSRATLGIEERRGGAMAVFISAGTLGFACGPTYFSFLAQRLGLDRMWWGALPGIVISFLLLSLLPEPPAAVCTHARSDWGALRAFWKPIALLYALVYLRSIIQIVFAQFVPLYLVRERGYSLTTASLALTAYLSAGAIGGFLGGNLTDRFGGRIVIIVSLIGSVPFLLLFFLASGPAALVSLVAAGFVLLCTVPVNVVMAQDLVPAQAGTVSALMMGFAWGSAGLLFIPLTGWMADRMTLHYTLMSLVAFPVIGFLLSLKLPKTERRRA